jgi:hypothetical protein
MQGREPAALTQHLHKGGVQHVGQPRASGRRRRPRLAAEAGRAAGRARGGPACIGDAAARVRACKELLRRAPELHHLHAQRLALRRVPLSLQLALGTAGVAGSLLSQATLLHELCWVVGGT